MNNHHSSRTQRMLIEFFKLKQAKTGLVRLSHGAQFSNVGSTLGFIGSLFLLLAGVVFIIQGAYLISVIMLLICIAVLGYVLDFQGIEIDTDKGNIRNYRSFLGLRSGDWHNINNFNQLQICQDSVLEKRAIAGGSTYSSSKSFDNHNFIRSTLPTKRKNILSNYAKRKA